MTLSFVGSCVCFVKESDDPAVDSAVQVLGARPEAAIDLAPVCCGQEKPGQEVGVNHSLRTSQYLPSDKIVILDRFFFCPRSLPNCFSSATLHLKGLSFFDTFLPLHLEPSQFVTTAHLSSLPLAQPSQSRQESHSAVRQTNEVTSHRRTIYCQKTGRHH